LQEAESLLKSDEDEFNRQVDAFEEKVQQVTALGEKVKKQSEEVRERETRTMHVLIVEKRKTQKERERKLSLLIASSNSA
jgi:hypothetical protein